jgi:hypothetical protein
MGRAFAFLRHAAPAVQRHLFAVFDEDVEVVGERPESAVGEPGGRRKTSRRKTQEKRAWWGLRAGQAPVRLRIGTQGAALGWYGVPRWGGRTPCQVPKNSRASIHDPRSTIHDPRSTIHDPRSDHFRDATKMVAIYFVTPRR